MAAINALARRVPRLPLPVPAYLSLCRISAGARHIRVNRRKSRSSYPLAFLASLFNARLSPRLRCPLYLFNAEDDALFTPTHGPVTLRPAARAVQTPDLGCPTAAIWPP